LLIIGAALCSCWWFLGESFLSLTKREQGDILVVEGWIGATGISAAKSEFIHGNYRTIITTSGLSGERWDKQRWCYATEAEEQLLRSGIPKEQLIRAIPADSDAQRTFESAIAVREALHARGLRPISINLFTRDVHARRSRLVYAKVLGPNIKVGVIAWLPPGYETSFWWKSSGRAADMLKETMGYWFELLMNSARTDNRA
jgi:uncharacterized SAM-binding protein YcdF (DUF218 family)